MKSAICEAPPSYWQLGTGQFPHKDKKYTFCCGIHVMTGAKVLGILGLLYFVYDLFEICFSDWDIFSWRMIVDIPVAMSLILLLVGIYKKKAVFLLPCMVKAVIALLIIALLLVLTAVAYRNPSTGDVITIVSQDAGVYLKVKGGPPYNEILVSSLAVILLLLGFLASLFLYIICKSYRYLSDLEVYNSRCRRVPNH